ncbi:hypothetical protein [Methylobacterium soli]|uniref:Uncharacterized protein n=1 Tax=Methylobacterium soli TaxID=553447 RepID=A0A6L3SNS2_9HYPH|nr:hypothetical protein [Methylobacterium soli]KAB1070065.1 hypothetical protein F6X53_30515 [Methylobacterium soli]GJE43275.1 hypothetical protein AEGHOMDF_2454 [Methylobacterium soli]
MELKKRELELSPLSGRFTQDGITVEVKIYRFVGDAGDWALEVVDHDDGSTVWNELFPTDTAAFEAFKLAVEEDGIASFLEPPDTLH